MRISQPTRTRAGAVVAAALGLVAGCGGGGSSSVPTTGAAEAGCDGSCATATSRLSVGDVESVLARAIAEAQAENAHATIAVVDRLGNVLAVFRMNGAASTVTASTGAAPGSGGLEDINIVPAEMAAISKAITGAYLSSEGNAFSTRTAAQIVQAHFNPGETLTPSGPLFGVQFSQLPCSDLLQRTSASVGPGPQRSPLGLSADAGGFPLYKGGTPVGGVGVIADERYGADAAPTDPQDNVDERIALAAGIDFAAPADRRADRITADGKTLRYSAAAPMDLITAGASPPSFASLDGSAGQHIPVPGYFAGSLRAGLAFGQPESGIRPDTLDFAGLDAFVLVDGANVERFRPRAGTEPGNALTAAEVRGILSGALNVAARARAQIRRPLGSAARVNIAVIDSNGVVLGMVRSRDAPLFATDVSLQKARSAALFSSPRAAGALSALPAAAYLDHGLSVLRQVPIGGYVSALRSFSGLPGALNDGEIAFSSRALGNLARPFYPDGVDGNPAGPLSKGAGEWSAFSIGLQLDTSYNALVQHIAFVKGAAPDVGNSCAGVAGFDAAFSTSPADTNLANGLQMFPGGVPIYRGSQLIGAIGVSGDGVDQDDLTAFLGLAEAADKLRVTAASAEVPDNAPAALRADNLVPQGSRMRYVGCPQSPFLNSSVQDACNGR